jgi:hypothetical protein
MNRASSSFLAGGGSCISKNVGRIKGGLLIDKETSKNPGEAKG